MTLVRFWGTRGSLAKPGPTTLRYGGNTSCVEFRTADGTLIVLDCGTGAHGLGQALLTSGAQPTRGHLLITHTHWDHIQGFPFFAPLFIPGNEWDLYAPGDRGRRLEATLAGQMEYTYFPVTLEQLGAVIRFHDLLEGQLNIGRVHIVAQYLNHPALTLGYRLEADGVAIVYAVDHEPHGRARPERGNLGAQSAAGSPQVHREDQRHIEFLAGADLVIHDAQYTVEEYPKKIGWGHCPAEWAVDYALAAGARRLALFHHDPLRDDDAVDRLVESCRRRVVTAGGGLDVFAAAEGQVLELKEPASALSPPISPLAAAMTAEAPAAAQTVLIADDDPTIVQLLVASLRSEGLRLLTASDGETALRMARAERPALILLDWHMPRLEGVQVARALRADIDAYFQTVPVVLITAETGPENTAAGFAAGVTDYLTKPFKPPLVRARVRAWLLRAEASPRSGV
jgi:CheY-like chemotaxis protein